MKLRGVKKHALILENERLKKVAEQYGKDNDFISKMLQKEREGISAIIAKALNMQIHMRPHMDSPNMICLRCELRVSKESFTYHNALYDEIAKHLVHEIRRELHKQSREIFSKAFYGMGMDVDSPMTINP